ncbi:MAG: aldo/keto reductase [Acidobacteria bacterium]|nr:aldo/keto reductase [Acidobacteriota bacterium]
MKMEFTRIPGLDVPVSRIGLGTWAIGGAFRGGSDELDFIRTMGRALESGINLIDTAPVYGYGASEEVLGKAIRRYRARDRVVVATKAGLEWGGGKIRRNASPGRLRRELEDSLKRLKIDVIDIYQLHWPDPKVSMEDVAEAMLRFREEGKVRLIGVSNFSVSELACFNRTVPVQVLQSPYNIFEREIENDTVPWCRENRAAILGYSALCRGLLSGMVGPGTVFSKGDARKVDPKFQPPRLNRYLEAVKMLDSFARERFGKRVIHLSLRFVLDMLPDGISLWGAWKPAHLAPLNDCFGWKLGPGALDEIGRIVAEMVPDPIGADFLAPPE